MQLFYIGIFGLMGIYSRYFLDAKLHSTHFPYSSFGVNMIGCLLAGCIAAFLSKNHSPIAQALMIGFCGGLTTFSGYGIQGINLFEQGQNLKALGFLVISPLLGLALAFVGNKFTRLFLLS